jgi:hypothetical protein
VTNQTYSADVARVVVEYALSNEVVVSSHLGVKFTADNSKALSFDETYIWIGFKCVC